MFVSNWAKIIIVINVTALVELNYEEKVPRHIFNVLGVVLHIRFLNW